MNFCPKVPSASPQETHVVVGAGGVTVRIRQVIKEIGPDVDVEASNIQINQT